MFERRVALLIWAGLAMSSAAPGAEGPNQTGSVHVPNVLISVIDAVEVPARETGVLLELNAREGDPVESGRVLGRVDDDEARLLADRARTDAAIAREKADNDVRIRLAEKALGVAKAELTRAEESNAKYANTVSKTEIDRLRLKRDEAELAIEQATHEQKIAALTADQKQQELELTELAVRRRQIVAPTAGRIVELPRKPGEWVQPGETVVRIVSTSRVLPDDPTGCEVRVRLALPGRETRELPGRIVFVDPQINAVNGQYRVWAEVENPDGVLRPGHRASMVILPQ
jgi:multidrug efflux pump subunit AcrA (membrane-fusion protein)